MFFFSSPCLLFLALVTLKSYTLTMKKAYVSIDAHRALTSYLSRLGCPTETVNHCGTTYYPVSTHPDIFMCRLGVWERPELFRGNPKKLNPSYPGNIIYNAVCTGRYFIHNLKHTDESLLSAAAEWKAHLGGNAGSLTYVDVPQGYSRCCCLPVDDTSFITSDAGIEKKLSAAGADVLLIQTGHIALPGFDYGFIGGCAGHILSPPHCHEKTAHGIDSDIPCDAQPSAASLRPTILFNGDLSSHPDYMKIANFIHLRGIDTAYFKDYPLTDIGSILTTW